MTIHKTLRDNIFVLFIVFVLIVTSIFIFVIFAPKPKIIQDITLFQPEKHEQETILIMSPKRPLVPESSYIYQVDLSGNLVKTFEIQDEAFTSFMPNQNINTPELFSLGLLGTVLRNYLLDYNLKEQRFSKIDLSYKHEDSGVSSVGYYGKHRLFATIASHVTGEQVDHTDTSLPYDPINGHYRIDSLCHVLTQQCIENNKNTFSIEKDLISFNNGNVLTIRGRMAYTEQVEGVYEQVIDLYNEQLQPIKNAVIKDVNMDNGFQIFFKDNTAILLPTIKKSDDVPDYYYVIHQDLSMQQIAYPSEPALNFANECVLQINEHAFIFITAEAGEEKVNIITFDADAFHVEALKLDDVIEKERRFILHSVDYINNKIYLEVEEHNMNNKRLFVIDRTNLTQVIEVPLPQVIKERESISGVVSVIRE